MTEYDADNRNIGTVRIIGCIAFRWKIPSTIPFECPEHQRNEERQTSNAGITADSADMDCMNSKCLDKTTVRLSCLRKLLLMIINSMTRMNAMHAIPD